MFDLEIGREIRLRRFSPCCDFGGAEMSVV